jgi:hypothetical protein
MPLAIETFSNIHGGNAFFKAISHPLAAQKAVVLIEGLKRKGPVAIYDPLGQAEAFAQFYDIKTLPIAGYYVQDVEKVDRTFSNHKAKLVTALKESGAKSLFVTSFDAEKPLAHIKHLIPEGVEVHSFDSLRIPDDMLSTKNYLAPLNFATNFVFFRDAGGQHTRLVSANYWGGYGAKEAGFWCRLFDGNGKLLTEWNEKLDGAQSTFILDSADVRKRFNLPEFTGQLFIHATKVAGHDIVKYALDTYGDAAHVLSCTHDANSWPSDFYAGLPAPNDDEEVVLWVQNSQPFPIPAGEVALNIMGEDDDLSTVNEEIAPFATYRLSVADHFPKARWPQQLEVMLGKYCVRPRYEVIRKTSPTRSRMAHVNVEREDLKPDPKLSTLKEMGKGHILPAPILPPERVNSLMLPTPMARGQKHLPLKAYIYDATGKQVAEHKFGNLSRNHASVLDVSAVLKGQKLEGGWGHVEFLYDFEAGDEADGWMHGLFRYVDKQSGHAAESSFGSHMFNSVLTYKGEPQSYAGRPPGLSTRLFLRLGQQPYDTFCHLIYPASTPWHAMSETVFLLHTREGQEIAQHQVRIPCSGSLLWKASEVFGQDQLKKAGEGAYIIIRDTTCRLFGFHGLLNGDQAFSLDHMFGF